MKNLLIKADTQEQLNVFLELAQIMGVETEEIEESNIVSQQNLMQKIANIYEKEINEE